MSAKSIPLAGLAAIALLAFASTAKAGTLTDALAAHTPEPAAALQQAAAPGEENSGKGWVCVRHRGHANCAYYRPRVYIYTYVARVTRYYASCRCTY